MPPGDILPHESPERTAEPPGAILPRESPEWAEPEPLDSVSLFGSLTSCAGLLFLVPVLESLGFADFLVSHPALLETGFPARLLQFIAERVGIKSDDPLVLALGDWDPSETVLPLLGTPSASPRNPRSPGAARAARFTADGVAYRSAPLVPPQRANRSRLVGLPAWAHHCHADASRPPFQSRRQRSPCAPGSAGRGSRLGAVARPRRAVPLPRKS